MAEDSSEIIADFFVTCNQQLLGLPREQIFGCDETNFRLDAPSNYTYAEIGATRVCATTTGHEMQKISVMACASASGFKFPLVIVVPRKTALKDFTPPDNTIVVYKPSGTFDSNLIVESFLKRYVILLHIQEVFVNFFSSKRVIQPEILRKNYDKTVLVWDHAPCHLTKEVQDVLVNCRTLSIEIPPKLTGLLQPADVCWFRTFKLLFRRKYMDWFVNEPKSFTNFGNLRSPGYASVIEWVSDIWQNIDNNLLIKSFDYCGITSQNELHHVLHKIHYADQRLGEIVETDIEADDEADYRAELIAGAV